MQITNSPVLIKSIRLQGYKSIKDETISLNNINVLIGCNGAGKSNLLSLFLLLDNLNSAKLRNYVAEKGGAQALLYNGKKTTDTIEIDISGAENLGFQLHLDEQDGFYCVETPVSESREKKSPFPPFFGTNFAVYHVDDTTKGASIKQAQNLVDDIALRVDAANLAPFLYSLKKRDTKMYNYYIETIRLVVPFFEDFVLEPNRTAENIILRWKQFGMDGVMNINQLSDGTLRFAALAALLLLQEEDKQPPIIIVDEPELGLHPFAVSVLCGLLKKAAFRRQIIIATQSKDAVNNFSAEDILVVDRDENGSHFKRLNNVALKDWLAEYSLGELWDKNILGGRLAK